MSKNNGFTLVEIIVIISLIAVISGIFSVSMINILDKSNQSMQNQVYTNMEVATDAFLHINRSILSNIKSCGEEELSISISTLIDAGYLKKSSSINENDKIYVCRDDFGVLRFRSDGNE